MSFINKNKKRFNTYLSTMTKYISLPSLFWFMVNCANNITNTNNESNEKSLGDVNIIKKYKKKLM